jgi:hypothetical protein
MQKMKIPQEKGGGVSHKNPMKILRDKNAWGAIILYDDYYIGENLFCELDK